MEEEDECRCGRGHHGNETGVVPAERERQSKGRQTVWLFAHRKTARAAVATASSTVAAFALEGTVCEGDQRDMVDASERTDGRSFERT